MLVRVQVPPSAPFNRVVTANVVTLVPTWPAALSLVLRTIQKASKISAFLGSY